MPTDLLTPEWLAHRYDETHDAIHLIALDRATRAGVPFLVDRDLPPREPVVAARADVVARAPVPASLHFILHSAFCCSTLLAKALDVPGVASTLSEPQLLADMTGWRLRGGEPRRVQAVLDQAMTLLARPFVPGEAVVIKPSNLVNGLASAMLTMRPEARAVLMYAPLPVFLASIARKGIDGRLWARELLSKQLAEGFVSLGFESFDYLLHTDLQAAAVGWLAQKALFVALAQRWPKRIRTLDSEILVARPEAAVRAVADLFGLAMDDAQIDATIRANFARNSKDGSVFAPGQREAARAAGAALHADEIDKVVIWAEHVARANGLPAAMPRPLLND
jgi:hypothetical protein